MLFRLVSHSVPISAQVYHIVKRASTAKPPTPQGLGLLNSPFCNSTEVTNSRHVVVVCEAARTSARISESVAEAQLYAARAMQRLGVWRSGFRV